MTSNAPASGSDNEAIAQWLDTLPTSVKDVEHRLSQLNYRGRQTLASRLGLKYKEDPKILVLIRDLLETKSLGDTIPVQTKIQQPGATDGSTSNELDVIENDDEDDEDAVLVDVPQQQQPTPSPAQLGDEGLEWDVIPQNQRVKLFCEQTDAGKKSSLRCFGIAMATIVGNEELLELIVQHPSIRMKGKAQEALNMLRHTPMENDAPRKVSPKVDDEESLLPKFEDLWRQVKEAPITRLPGDPSTNLERLFRADASKATQIILATAPQLTDENRKTPIPPQIVLQMFKFAKQYFRNRELAEEHLTVLKPIFDRLQVTSTSESGGIVVLENKLNWDDLIKSRPESGILIYLIEEAFTILQQEFRVFVKTLREKVDEIKKKDTSAVITSTSPDDPKIHTRIFLTKVSNVFKYLQPLLQSLTDRLVATAHLSNKADAQIYFETKIKPLVSRALTLSCEIAQHTDIKELIGAPEMVAEEWDWGQKKLIPLFTNYKPLVILIFEQRGRQMMSLVDNGQKSVDLNVESAKILQPSPVTPEEQALRSTLQGLAKQYIANLRSKPKQVAEFPDYSLSPPYCGIPPWTNDNVIRFLLEKLNPRAFITFWTSDRGSLTTENIKMLRSYVDKSWLLDVLYPKDFNIFVNVLQSFFLPREIPSDIKEQHDIAYIAYNSVKAADFSLESEYLRKSRMETLMQKCLDIDVDEIRQLAHDKLALPSIEERVESVKLLMNMTFRVPRSNVICKTFVWLLNRIRNEMVLNMNMLMSAVQSIASEPFLHIITEEDTSPFIKALNTYDQNNLAAVTPSYSGTQFIERLYTEALQLFATNTSHPLFKWAIDTVCRHVVHFNGSGGLLTKLNFSQLLVNPSFDGFKRPELEIRMRKALEKGRDIFYALSGESASFNGSMVDEGSAPDAQTLVLGDYDVVVCRRPDDSSAEGFSLIFTSRPKQMPSTTPSSEPTPIPRMSLSSMKELWQSSFGLFMVDEGSEDQYVSMMLDYVKDKLQAAPDHNQEAFESTESGHKLLIHIKRSLGLRWTNSKILVDHATKCLDVLAKAPLHKASTSTEPILDWTSTTQRKACEFIEACGASALTFVPKWLHRYCYLRLRSTEAQAEAWRQFQLCNDNIVKQNQLVETCFRLSPSGSVLHVQPIMRFVLNHRPDLLKAEHFKERRAFIGLFNPTDTKSLLRFELEDASFHVPLPVDFLLPWQGELLTKRYMEDALDATLSINDRVLATNRMMQVSNLSIHDVAEFLLTPSLPSRVIEAVLMFLPKIDEPASTINLLLSPVFMESDLARTAIFSVKNVLAHMPETLKSQVLLSMIPSKSGKGIKITVFKELVRLLAEHNEIPQVLQAYEQLWYREKLHKDVRIVLLQTAVGLLTAAHVEARNVAWRLIEDCVNGEHIATAGIVLCTVTREYDPERVAAPYTYLTMPSGKYFSYRYGELSEAIIPKSVCSEYLQRALLPFALNLVKHIHNMPSKKVADYQLLLNWVQSAFYVLNNSWIDASNAQSVSAAIEPIALDSTTKETFEKMLFDFCFLTVAQCTAYQVTNETDPVPESWRLLMTMIQNFARQYFDSSLSVDRRLAAKTRLSALKLESILLPTAFTKSKAFLKVVLSDPMDAIDKVPRARDSNRNLRWSRKAQWLKNTAADVSKLSVVPDQSQVYAERSQMLMKEAESLLKEIFEIAYAPLVNGATIVTESNIRAKIRSVLTPLEFLPGYDDLLSSIYDNETWCQDKVPQIKGFYMDLKYFMLSNFQQYSSAGCFADFMDMAMDKYPEWIDKNCNSVLNMFVKLWKQLRDSSAALAFWTANVGKAAGNGRPKPQHDQEGLVKLTKALKRVGEKCDQCSYHPDSSFTKIFDGLLATDIFIFTMEQCSEAYQKYLQARMIDSPAFERWVSVLNGYLTSGNTTSANNLHYGIPIIRPHISALSQKALHTQFNSEKCTFTHLYTRLINASTHLFFTVDPETASGFVRAHPLSTASNHVADELGKKFGHSATSLYYEFMLRGRLDLFNISAAYTLASFLEEKYRAFELEVEVDAQSAGRGVSQTEKSRVRRQSVQSIEGVARSLLESGLVEVLVVKEGVSKGIDMSDDTESMSPGLNLIPHLTFQNPPQPTTTTSSTTKSITIENLPRSHLSKLLWLNPHLYFHSLTTFLSTHHQNPLATILIPPAFHLDPTFLPDSLSPISKSTKSHTHVLPVLYALDVSRTLARRVAPFYETAGQHRAAAAVRCLAIKILKAVHDRTAESGLNAGRPQGVSGRVEEVADVVLVEGCRGLGVVFEELVGELVMSGDEEVMGIGMGLLGSGWKLKVGDGEAK
ncbi:hypothetical protein HDV05_007068 [Chytridiales sp. JEL 0842]|nr:hypothetical protein HDV05_007068 [Chytridiales sp. JEL 0842]